MATITIDATNKRLGRVASEAARLILGKNSPSFARNVVTPITVVIENASKIILSDKKRSTTEYRRYSGYPGGLRSATMQEVIAKKGYAEVFRKTVYGMLPTNRLRAQRIKNLIVKE